MGTSRGRTRQATMWVPTADLPKSAGHPFYERLNRVLDDAGFDAFVEAQCASFYADGVGRPSLAPGRYFRLLLLGYFEGLDSERAIAWRAADSLSIRTFLDFALHEAPPGHSTLSRTRRLIDLETHQDQPATPRVRASSPRPRSPDGGPTNALTGRSSARSGAFRRSPLTIPVGASAQNAAMKRHSIMTMAVVPARFTSAPGNPSEDEGPRDQLQPNTIDAARLQRRGDAVLGR